MINLRYHIVSLTAVFLALAIGVTMGTTFLNTATVDELKQRISSAEAGIKETKASNVELRSELDRSHRVDDALTAASGRLVDGELTDVPVLVLASEDIDTASLDKMRTMLVNAGADLRGTLTITDRLRLEDGDAGRVAEVLGREPGATPQAVLQAELAQQLGEDLAAASDRSRRSEAESSELITKMVEADLLGFQAVPDGPELAEVLAGGGFRYVFVSGPTPKTPDADFLLPVLRALVAGEPAQVVFSSAAQGDTPEETRTVAVGAVRDDTALRDEVSTVDDLERFGGQVANVWALADVADGIHGHYGLGDGAQSELPTPR